MVICSFITLNVFFLEESLRDQDSLKVLMTAHQHHETVYIFQ